MIRRLEEQLKQLQVAKDELEARQNELQVMLNRLEDSKNLEAAERAKLEEEIMAKQSEVQLIQDEVAAKDTETKRLQQEVEEARRKQVSRNFGRSKHPQQSTIQNTPPATYKSHHDHMIEHRINDNFLFSCRLKSFKWNFCLELL